MFRQTTGPERRGVVPSDIRVRSLVPPHSTGTDVSTLHLQDPNVVHGPSGSEGNVRGQGPVPKELRCIPGRNPKPCKFCGGGGGRPISRKDSESLLRNVTEGFDASFFTANTQQ